MGKKKKQEKQKKKKLRELMEQQETADSGISKKKPDNKKKDIPDKYERGILPRPGAESSQKAADVFRAFGDETRLQIMQILEGKELCNSEILQYVSVVQSTLSHHMRVLTDAGVVKCRRYGKFAYYSLCPDRFEDAIEWLKYYQMISSVPVKKEETEETVSGGEDGQEA